MGQKWAWRVRSGDFKIKWVVDLLPADTNSRKLEVTFIIFGWARSNVGMAF